MKKELRKLVLCIILVCLFLMFSYSRCVYIIKNTCLSKNWMATVNQKYINPEFANKINSTLSNLKKALEDPIAILKWKLQNFFHI